MTHYLNVFIPVEKNSKVIKSIINSFAQVNVYKGNSEDNDGVFVVLPVDSNDDNGASAAWDLSERIADEFGFINEGKVIFFDHDDVKGVDMNLDTDIVFSFSPIV